MTSISLRLSEDILNRLNNLAKITGRTKTYYIQEAVNEKLADMEDYYAAEKAWLEFESGDRKTYTSDEIIAKYDL